MGAYGSPELFPPEEPRYDYNTEYVSNYQRPYKIKRGWGKFFLGLFLGSLLTFLFTNFADADSLKETNAPMFSSSFSVLSSSSVLKSSVSDADGCLLDWIKIVVKKALLYPDSAQFSDDISDWQITRSGNNCEINSIVIAKGKSDGIGKTKFKVKVSYGELYAQVTYIQIGSHVSYDSSKD